ncbi:uncharacterized protein LOC107839963 [Capsicum annuum]|uniref:uncharacterized protein LOC107839963 n=1 Tax=Capsicum annuum TaxID=4072 RepID=UPI001FB076E0|nr:uncharacterized protein LOC107839963 [Capsicum annuum]XP_047250828.1 uncharacterized protein LOC107839963 [Capsicum annuum]
MCLDDLPCKGHKLDIEFGDKLFNIKLERHCLAECCGPLTTTGLLPHALGLYSCNWVDTGQAFWAFLDRVKSGMYSFGCSLLTTFLGTTKHYAITVVDEITVVHMLSCHIDSTPNDQGILNQFSFDPGANLFIVTPGGYLQILQLRLGPYVHTLLPGKDIFQRWVLGISCEFMATRLSAARLSVLPQRSGCFLWHVDSIFGVVSHPFFVAIKFQLHITIQSTLLDKPRKCGKMNEMTRVNSWLECTLGLLICNWFDIGQVLWTFPDRVELGMSSFLHVLIAYSDGLINKPTADFFSYGFEKENNGTIIVFDPGGTILDVIDINYMKPIKFKLSLLRTIARLRLLSCDTVEVLPLLFWSYQLFDGSTATVVYVQKEERKYQFAVFIERNELLVLLLPHLNTCSVLLLWASPLRIVQLYGSMTGTLVNVNALHLLYDAFRYVVIVFANFECCGR